MLDEKGTTLETLPENYPIVKNNLPIGK